MIFYKLDDQRSKKQSNKLRRTNSFVFPSGILAHAPYNSSIPVSFSLFCGCFYKNFMHYWKSFIISSTLSEFKGVNEKWKQSGNWFNDKFQFFSFMNFWIALTEYFGWSNPIQQILGSPNTLNPKVFSYFANLIVAKLIKKIPCWTKAAFFWYPYSPNIIILIQLEAIVIPDRLPAKPVVP